MSGADTSSISVLDSTGRSVDVGELRSHEVEIDTETAELLVSASRSSGRYFARDGLIVAGTGCAARIALNNGLGEGASAASQVLGEIGGDHSRGALAVTALPFDRTAPGELVLPRRTVVIDERKNPRLVVQGTIDEIEQIVKAPAELPDTERAVRATTALPDGFELTASQSHEAFKKAVSKAVATIESGAFAKVVLAREIVVRANRAFRQGDLIERLAALYPSSAVFAVDGFLGASPELLVRRKDNTARSHPLAGTIPRSGDPEEDARLASRLFTSDKDRTEHGYVVDDIATRYRAVGASVTTSEQPHLLELRNVVHLATLIDATFSSDAITPSVLELTETLHPTAAVGGFPRDATLSYLASNEPFERDRYAGPVGYLRGNGDGELFIGIRSTELSGAVARLFAGVGIVAGSEPDSELAETQLKLQALLSAAVRP